MPMLRARGMEMLIYPTTDGAELWARTIFDIVSVIKNEQQFKLGCDISTKIDHLVV